MGRRTLLGVVAALVLARGATAASPRLVVLYVACTVNTQYLGPYNRAVDYTPNLSAFARDAVVFRRHVTEAGQSGIAFASIFTGAQALRHGAFWHPCTLDRGVYEISEAFRDAGYDTFYWAGQPMVGPELGYARGARVTYRDTKEDIDRYTAIGPEFVAILDRLQADPDYRAFVQIGLTLTHSPYVENVSRDDVLQFMQRRSGGVPPVEPETFDRFTTLYAEHLFDLQWDFERTIGSLGLGPDDVRMLDRVVDRYYAASVERLDTSFGRLVASIRARHLLDDSIVAFTADHGEVMGRRNALYHWTHGFQLAPEGLSVPWIIRAPGRVPPGTYEAVTRSIDVFPTLAGLSGVRLPATAPVDGVDLTAALVGTAPRPALRAYFHTAALGSPLYTQMRASEGITRFYKSEDVDDVWVGLREGDLVYKWRNLDGTRWGLQVFDLAADPEETHDLFDPANPEQARMLVRLLAYKRRLVKSHARRVACAKGPSSGEAHRLPRTLGYIQ